MEQKQAKAKGMLNCGCVIILALRARITAEDS